MSGTSVVFPVFISIYDKTRSVPVESQSTWMTLLTSRDLTSWNIKALLSLQWLFFLLGTSIIFLNKGKTSLSSIVPFAELEP